MRHDIEVELVDPFTSDECAASCACGWVGEVWEDYDDAELEGDDHRHRVNT